MYTKESEKIIEIIKKMIQEDRGSLNNEMAREASRQMGKNISKKRISQLRNQIGLGMFNLVAKEVIKKSIGFYQWN